MHSERLHATEHKPLFRAPSSIKKKKKNEFHKKSHKPKPGHKLTKLISGYNLTLQIRIETSCGFFPTNLNVDKERGVI